MITKGQGPSETSVAPPVVGSPKSLIGDYRSWCLLLAAIALLLLPELLGEAGRLALRYDRSGIAAGEYWRLLSAHIVHLNLAHALLNALGLALLWALFSREYSPGRWVVILLASSLAISAGLWFLSPGVEWYVGASGVLHGVMAAGALAAIRRRERWGWGFAILLGTKLAWEAVRGPMPFSAQWEIVSIAHLYGALGGLAAALCLRPRPEPL